MELIGNIDFASLRKIICAVGKESTHGKAGMPDPIGAERLQSV